MTIVLLRRLFVLLFMLTIFHSPGNTQEPAPIPPPNPAFMKALMPEMRETILNNPPMDFKNKDSLAFWRSVMNLDNLPNLPVHPEVNVTNHMIPYPDGKGMVRVRIYEPKNVTGILPGVIWIHGGGMFLGSPELDEVQSQRIALELPCIVVAPAYRLTPEFPYPAALDDCYAVLQWFSKNASQMRVDPKRIAVAGASAGGNLTAALTLLARDRQGPHIAFQMPLYPMLDDRAITPSSKEPLDMRVWNAEANAFAWKIYLGKNKKKVTPYMAPARAKDLRDLPPAYSCVGTLDLFRDETIDYMARLAQHGVPVELHVYPAVIHAFENIFPNLAISQAAKNEYINALKKALQPTN